MDRKKALCIAIACMIPVVFVLIVLAIYSVLLMLIVLLGLIVGLGMLKRKRPDLFELLAKPQPTLPPLMDRPVEPQKHQGLQKAYMNLIGVNASNQRRITIDNSFFTIGRSADCNYQLDDAMVSRHHLTIEYDEETKQCFVTDNSSNGTFLNSVRLKHGERTALKQGDNLQIASTAFSVEYAHY